MRPTLDRLRNHVESILRAAVHAVEPQSLVRAAHHRGVFDPLGDAPVHVVSAGKAAWPMAGAVAGLMSDRVRSCVVAGPRMGTAKVVEGWVTLEPGHPVPDAESIEAGTRALAIARRAGDDWLLVLLSGGASAMLAAPRPPLTLDQKIEATRALLPAGLPIDRLNCVRKHLSAIKGGQLGARAKRSLTLAISDVHAPVPDDLSVIASGPTAPDGSTFAEALEISRSVGGVPAAVLEHLERGVAGLLEETIKPGDPRLAHAFHQVIGNRRTAMEEAARAAASLGYAVEALTEPLVGEARESSQQFVSRAHALAHGGSRPLCVIAAGETTVRVSGAGLGGRNQEVALAATPFVTAIGRAAVLASAGTDGTDGPTDAAGAIVDSSTLERSQRAGLDWQASLRANDAYHFFLPLGDLLRWGPTGTNVGDLQIMLIA